MKYAFLGSTEFSERVLAELIASPRPPALLITNPARPSGRKRALTPPPVKALAEKAGIPVLQPEKLDAELARELRAQNFDVFVLASFGKILSPAFLSVPRLGVIGVHVSLLPKYRGPSPMQSAILAGEKETGVSLYLMDDQVDHGPVLAEKKIALREQTFLELQAESAKAGAEFLIKVLPEFVSGKLKPREQDGSGATYTKKFRTEDGFVEPETLKAALSGEHPETAERVWRKIRALNPEPGVWSYGAGLPADLQVPAEKRVKLLEASFNSGKLVLKTIQAEGKNPRKLG